MIPREQYAARAMTVLMMQHPNATRGWIKQMAFDMADVMLLPDGPEQADPARPLAHQPRVYAEDEVEHGAQHAAKLAAAPDSIRFLGRYVPGFTP